MITCGELMTPSPTCCQAEHTIEEAAELMKRRNVGLIPVVGGDNARLIGVVTDRDIVVNVVAAGLDPRQTAVSEVMTPDPVFCRPEDSADKALELMAARQVRRIPIVDEHGGLVGIVAQADVATRLKDPQRTGEVVEAISGEDYGRLHEARENRLQPRGASLEGRAARS